MLFDNRPHKNRRVDTHHRMHCSPPWRQSRMILPSQIACLLGELPPNPMSIRFVLSSLPYQPTNPTQHHSPSNSHRTHSFVFTLPSAITAPQRQRAEKLKAAYTRMLVAVRESAARSDSLASEVRLPSPHPHSLSSLFPLQPHPSIPFALVMSRTLPSHARTLSTQYHAGSQYTTVDETWGRPRSWR
jgi:hypothetical protein